MASWLRPEKKDDQKHLPSPQLKSRIPVRMNRLCSDNVRSSSSKDKADKTAGLQKDLGNKVQSKRSSRIPIVVNGRKTKVGSKDNLPMNFKTIQGGKPLGRDSGMFISQQLASVSFFTEIIYRKLKTFYKTVSGEQLESPYCLYHNIHCR